MTASRRPPGAANKLLNVSIAAGCWLVLTGILLLTPSLRALQPASSIVAPPLGAPGWWWCLVAITVQATVLVMARSRPRTALLAVAALPLPLSGAGMADLYSLTSGAVMVAVFLAVTARPLASLRAALTGSLLLVAAGVFVNRMADAQLAAGPALVAALLQTVGAIGLPLLVGLAAAGRRDAREARHQEAQAEGREQDALVRAAVADERTAMARELHDIAAHHLSGIALMAAAVERQIDTQPETAKRSVREVRAESMSVLEDLRRLVGLLRTETDAARDVHSLAAVPDLVAQRRAAGAPVTLRTWPADPATRAPRPLGDRVGPIAQLALYRIAQESLANAAAHAPGAAVVVEIDDRSDTALTLTVTNEASRGPQATRRGFGLIGMRERADLLGATLTYGATSDGGWEVRVRMPKDDVGHARPLPRGRSAREETPA